MKMTATTWMRAAALLLAMSLGDLGAQERTPPATQPPRAGADTAVFVLPVQGPIDQSMLYIFRRAFAEIAKLKPAAVIVELDTPGGRLIETREIIQWLRSLKPDTAVYAFVNPNAYSAGAIISLATDKIFMSPAGYIGDAMPIMISPMGGGVQEMPEHIREKMISPTRALVRGLAQENGYNVELAEAMVDPDREFNLAGVSCPKGELLTLTSQEAVRTVPPDNTPLLATALVKDIPELLSHVGLEGAAIVRFEEVGAEQLARWITGLGPLLLSLAILGIFIELRTPGFGVFGITGMILLVIYFFGHYVAGLAGYEEIVLVFIGLALLAIEVLVIPGFGVVGVLGIILIAVGTIMGLVPVLPTDVPALPGGGEVGVDVFVVKALYKFALSAFFVGAGAWALGKILPRTSVYHRLVLASALGKDQGYVTAGGTLDKHLGAMGIARTALRPAGTGEFADEWLDVVTSGDMIDKGTPILVVRVEGNRIVVEEAPETEKNEQSEAQP